MKIAVVGLWHLGSVTAACLAETGHDVTGVDVDRTVVERLQAGTPPLFEPGLAELIEKGIAAGRLQFTSNVRDGIVSAAVVWIALDTPVDEDDRPDVESVARQAEGLFEHLRDGALVLVSSQVSVGTTARLEETFRRRRPNSAVTFAYTAENLQLGRALSAFLDPERVVVGTRTPEDRRRIGELLAGVTDQIVWMSVESAEMTKHALNAFLATSVAFSNEIAVLCEEVGADAKDVETGLRTDRRIGPRAYLAPGAAFAGGTLARDIQALTALGVGCGQPTHLLAAVRTSNAHHRQWVQRKLFELVGQELRAREIAVWGLTYKPGTSTLRRSASMELCRWLAGRGASIKVHDPTVSTLGDEAIDALQVAQTPLEAARGASVLIVATEWQDYLEVLAADLVSVMTAPVVIDPNRFLVRTLGSDAHIRYAAVGMPTR